MNLVLADNTVQDAEHALFLAAGYLYFLPLTGREPVRWKVSYPLRMFLLFLAMPVDAFTGVVLGSEGSNPFPALKPGPWGPSPLNDVHDGGAVMWVGGAAIMLVLLLATFFAWTRETRPSAGLGWLGTARRASLAAAVSETAAPGPAAAPVATGNIDEGDEHLAAYNAYLARLNAAPAPGQSRHRPGLHDPRSRPDRSAGPGTESPCLSGSPPAAAGGGSPSRHDIFVIVRDRRCRKRCGDRSIEYGSTATAARRVRASSWRSTGMLRDKARRPADSGTPACQALDPSGARHEVRRRARRAKFGMPALAAAAATAAAACAAPSPGTGQELRPSGIPASISTSLANLMSLDPLPGQSAPGFTLTDQAGRTMPLSALRGKVVVLEFMDDHCTDICPIVAQEFTDAYRDLGPAAARVVFAAVNVNPYYRSVRDVAAFSAAHQLTAIPGWHFFTGPLPALRTAWNAYDITVQASGQHADVLHTSAIYFIGPHGRERYLASPQDTAQTRPRLAYGTKNETGYVPAGQMTDWGHGIALLARSLTG